MQNYIINSIFKNKKVDFNRLEGFGFKKQNGIFCYKCNIVDEQFCLSVFVNAAGEISTQVVEIETNEPYTLFLVQSAVGSFVGRVR